MIMAIVIDELIVSIFIDTTGKGKGPVKGMVGICKIDKYF